MGDNIALNECESVRTPMQWDNSRNAGFSTAAVTLQPVINTANYTYHRLNVAMEQEENKSLLAFIKSAIAIHKQHPEISFL